MKSKTNILSIFCIILLAGILRFVSLGQNPPGLTNDEADIGYDAYSLLLTGKDQWGELFPLSSFKGFGDYRPPLYTYLVVPSIAMFGVNEFAVRFPSALLGVLTILLTFLLTRKIFNGKIALIAAFLSAISPWHIGMSRVGIESNVAVFLTVLASYLFFLSLKNPKMIIFTVLVAILGLNTYYSMRIFIPIIGLGLFVLYRNKFHKAKRIILLSLLLGMILLLPIAKSFTESGGQGRLGQITFTKDIGLVNLINEKRGSCQTKLPSVICKIAYNKPLTYFSTFLTNYINHFSPNLLFLYGSSTSQSVMPQRGFLYLFELPLLLVGLVLLVLKKSKESFFLLLWILVAPLADSLTSSGHYSRMLAFLPTLQIATSYGFMSLSEWLKNVSLPLKKTFVAIFVLISFISLSAFLVDYSTYYPTFFSRSSHYGYKELFQYLKVYEDKYSEIIISNKYYDTKQYIFYLFYTQYDPRKYQEITTKDIQMEQEGWIRVSRIDNYYFLNTVKKISNFKDTSLIVADPKEFPKDIKTQQVLFDVKGDPTFSLVSGNDLLLYKIDAGSYGQ